ncbi:hypothetical protein AAFF_G00184050 [Aldrovandia affinis]|uniref:C1q domain-containing protein n=1 Tax=Aldrovandia affinis TaxID=143900 RepID=A0AAD7W6L4_9TELE|nr:hypothetical protein AAFF_G00184050 [Aldrovandia affinis]
MRGLVLLCLFVIVLGSSEWSDWPKPEESVQESDPKPGNPHRSVFSAVLSDDPTCFRPHQVDDVVRYTNILVNEGNGYNESSGVFRAPLQGLYSLAVTVYTMAGRGGHFCATLQKNGVVLASTTGDSASLAVAVYLKVGDKVSVFLHPGCMLCTTQNTFTGFLLYADD